MKQTATEKKSSDRARVVWFGFAAIGIILIMTSTFFADSPELETIKAVLFNLGIVVVAVVIVELIWRFVGGDPLRKEINVLNRQVERLAEATNLVEQREKIGLISVHDKLSNFGTEEDWVRLLGSATESVDLIGRALFGWHDARELGEILVSKIKTDGVRFRWLIMSPENPYLSQLDKEPGAMLSHKIDRMCNLFREIIKKLPSGHAGHLQLRGTTETPITCSILRFDDVFVVNQYLSTRSSRKCPLFVAKGRKAAWPVAFREEFELLWKGADDLLSF